jgi:hypothetical protein
MGAVFFSAVAQMLHNDAFTRARGADCSSICYRLVMSEAPTRARISGGAIAEPPESATPTLADIGISKKLSSRAQSLAAIPAAEDFEVTLDEHRAQQQAVTAIPEAGLGRVGGGVAFLYLFHARKTSKRKESEAQRRFGTRRMTG